MVLCSNLPGLRGFSILRLTLLQRHKFGGQAQLARDLHLGRLPHCCAESPQHLREDQEVTLSRSRLTNPPFVQHHRLERKEPCQKERHKKSCVCVCLPACRCPAAACPAWLKSSEKTMANRDEASLCCELTQPKDLRTVNMACTRSTGERSRINHLQMANSNLSARSKAPLTAHLLSGRARLLEERVGEGLARRRFPRSTASHRAHAVVSPAAHHGHVHTFDQSSQRRRRVPHVVSPPRLWHLTGEQT